MDRTAADLPDAWQTLFDALEPLPRVASESRIVPLADYGILEIEGADAARFLQGQLTCDVERARSDRATAGAQCSIKGRVLASFLLLRTGPARYWLRLRRDILGETASSLGKYMVFFQAELRVRDDLVGVGLLGPAASVRLAGTGPGARLATHGSGDTVAVQRDTQGQRVEAWSPAIDAARIAATCKGLVLANSAEWELLNIQAGEVDVSAVTRDQFLPQMLNYDALDAVHFDKGCYTGQEVVARAHYRGQVKRRLRRFSSDGAAPGVGEAIKDAGGRDIGLVMASADRELLAVTSARLSDEDLPLRGGASELRAEPLPYAIKDSDQ